MSWGVLTTEYSCCSEEGMHSLDNKFDFKWMVYLVWGLCSYTPKDELIYRKGAVLLWYFILSLLVTVNWNYNWFLNNVFRDLQWCNFKNLLANLQFFVNNVGRYYLHKLQ